ncbi:MAG: hypothetical protein IPH16_21150 [Haliscomenobacter sp.]|nr:hypothetical protein [Haliscomenobacter sp.]
MRGMPPGEQGSQFLAQQAGVGAGYGESLVALYAVPDIFFPSFDFLDLVKLEVGFIFPDVFQGVKIGQFEFV